MSDFVTRYIIMLFSASAILAVSVILLMLSVPLTGEWKNFRTVRLCLAFTCLVLSASDFVSCFAMDSNQEAQLFSTLTLIEQSGGATVFHVDIDCRLLSGDAFHHGIAGFRAVAARPSTQRTHAVGHHHSRRSFPPCVAIPFPEALPRPLCYCHSRLHRANHPLHPYIPQGLQVVRATA